MPCDLKVIDQRAFLPRQFRILPSNTRRNCRIEGSPSAPDSFLRKSSLAITSAA